MAEPEDDSDRTLLAQSTELGISEILAEKLYVSGYAEAHNASLLQKLKITHIVSLTLRPLGSIDPGISRKHVQIGDVEETNLLPLLDDLHAHMDNALKGGATLVHCDFGISRSVAVTISWLMKRLSMSLPEAYEVLKRKRRISSPNWSFLRQLVDYEATLTPKSALGLPFLLQIVRDAWSLDKAEFSDAQLLKALEAAQYKPTLLVGELYP